MDRRSFGRLALAGMATGALINRITGGGVTAGLDFALRLAARLRGEDVARTIQLVLEYELDPPFDSGSPEAAGSEAVNSVLQRRSPLIQRAREALLSL